jgi:thiol-disulfide isomerase/thioredoxin
MLKKSLLTVGAILLISLVLFMIHGIVEKVIAMKAVAEKKLTLTTVPFFNTDSTNYRVDYANPILLVHFNSECEHCQYELAELSRNLNALQHATVLLMSSENIAVIKKTAQDLGFVNTPNVNFLKINRENVFENFGSLSTPHVFIYGKDRKLIKEFKGETKIEAILQYLPQ